MSKRTVFINKKKGKTLYASPIAAKHLDEEWEQVKDESVRKTALPTVPIKDIKNELEESAKKAEEGNKEKDESDVKVSTDLGVKEAKEYIKDKNLEGDDLQEFVKDDPRTGIKSFVKKLLTKK